MKNEDELIDAITARIESQFLLAAHDAHVFGTGWVKVEIGDDGTIKINRVSPDEFIVKTSEDLK